MEHFVDQVTGKDPKAKFPSGLESSSFPFVLPSTRCTVWPGIIMSLTLHRSPKSFGCSHPLRRLPHPQDLPCLTLTSPTLKFSSAETTLSCPTKIGFWAVCRTFHSSFRPRPMTVLPLPDSGPCFTTSRSSIVSDSGWGMAPATYCSTQYWDAVMLILQTLFLDFRNLSRGSSGPIV